MNQLKNPQKQKYQWRHIICLAYRWLIWHVWLNSNSWYLTASTESWRFIVSVPSGRSEVVEVGAHRRHKKQQQ